MDDKESAGREVSLPELHLRHRAPTIALCESPELADFVKETVQQ